MDTLCGIGLPELVILALVGFVLIGPERSQDMALRAGRLLRTVMRSSWWRDFNQVADSLRDLPNTLVRMAELEEAQADLRRSVQEIEEEVTEVGRIMPPSLSERPDATTDPWGIRNATAQTRIMSDPPFDKEEVPTGSEASNIFPPPETNHEDTL